MDNKRKHSFEKFISGKGFYIALFLCVAAIGIAGYTALFSGSSGNSLNSRQETIKPIRSPEVSSPAATPFQTEVSPETGGAVQGKGEKSAESGSTFSGSREERQESSQAGALAQNESTSEAETQPETSVQQTVSGSFIDESTLESGYLIPVEGELYKRYSMDSLQFNETLGDWRVHGGVDILADEGSHVTAVYRGTVERVYQDDSMGNTVVINHPDGISSTYSNLAPEVCVHEGQTVEGGELLGYVGKSALSESSQLPHLHFEMEYEGVSVDPLDILKID